MEVSLQEVLAFREKKAMIQAELIRRTPCGFVISLGMNIPGPIKTGPLYYRAFSEGKRELEGILLKAGTVSEHIVLDENAGYAAIYLLQSELSSVQIKTLSARLEESHSLGRLFDIDVTDGKGQAIGRELCGLPRRKCLICGCDAKECGRSRRHSVESLQKKTKEIIAEWISEQIGDTAHRALLEELYTTPKPGLVDLYSCGAHKDMDVTLFEKSAAALFPWFTEMARQGLVHEGTPKELFLSIRKTGILSEEAMYEATDGVNTHKGLIFTIGVFCAAAGHLIGEDRELSLEELIKTEQQMVSEVLKGELGDTAKKDKLTNGEKNLQKYGSLGIRGEAIGGYRSVTKLALPILQNGIKEGRPWNQVKLQALLTLMKSVEDSNVLYRHDKDTLYEMHKAASEFLESGGAYQSDAEAILKEMDARYIEKNLSPGGCADLLATAVFLYYLLYETKDRNYDFRRQAASRERAE